MAFSSRSLSSALVLAALAALANPSVATSASFSCMETQSMSTAEQAVCSSRRLGALDERLDSWYRRALERARYFEQTSRVRGEQRAWLERRDACGGNAWCLRRTYRVRIEQLRRYVEHV